ncbi:M14 family metallopeptidase [Ulvibacterium sp.]|uniref:M14 family metallopeptidase n=1 Tax=Ulvibacterium sp. TaxID=2665914 RepID=UPI002607D341|nr:M14 family metallopeptidase [Ulvibacterium sp.]
MKQFLLTLLLAILPFSVVPQDLKSPSEFLGYPLGTQFTRHHQVVDYYKYLAEKAPDRMQFLEYGKTNEGRLLFLAYLSSAENMGNLENIRTEHLRSMRGEGNASKVIVWLSYNVHGNESVGTEASMKTIHSLLKENSDYLKNTVVIIDPCLNPDGRDRYVNWYNQYKNTPYTVDPNSTEHHQGWWTGRSNHYMFDLNRDWAWLTQMESRQRLKVYNKWFPHVHVDFHEQGVDEPYYFAPAAEPYHEVITAFQRSFQIDIGKNHAKYFDAEGWFYFTKESFDLLYPSYGDTYPTYNGAIGMTYEQGGSGRAGLGIITQIGDTLTLKDRIVHHHTTGLSTVEISTKNAEKLITEFKKFFKSKKYKYKSYLLNGEKDKLNALAQLLDQHQIEYGSGKGGTARGFRFMTGKTGNIKNSEESMVVSTDQLKGTLVKVLFEPSTKLSDSLTYDITAWSLPYAYGLDALASETKIEANTDNPWRMDPPKEKSVAKDNYAYVAQWKHMKDARFLAELLQEKIRVRYAKKPFATNGKKYERGSLIITKGDNANNANFNTLLTEIANKHHITLETTDTGFVESGKDFGSEYVRMVPKVKVAMLSGEPTSTLRFGEIWHFFERQLGYPITIIDTSYLESVDLSGYDVLILPGGDGYTDFADVKKLQRLKKWVSNGGRLIAMGGAIQGLAVENGFGLKQREAPMDSMENLFPYEETVREQLRKEIRGAIFKAKVDPTHPLAFGYDDIYFTLKQESYAYEYLDSGSVVYLEQGAQVPVAGFAGIEAQKKLNRTLVFGVEAHGQGKVVYLVDNPLFRGFWENGKLFMANALFMLE